MVGTAKLNAVLNLARSDTGRRAVSDITFCGSRLAATGKSSYRVMGKSTAIVLSLISKTDSWRVTPLADICPAMMKQ
jgi:hypothetical protein